MCTSHAVLQLCTHFFNLDKLLVLLSSEDFTQDKIVLISLFTFAHPLISKHYTEGKAKAENCEDKGKPLWPPSSQQSAIFSRLPISSQPTTP